MSVSALFGLFLAAAAQDAEPPEEKAPAVVCKCAEAPPADAVIFEGVPYDAQITLDANGQKPEPRQATLFRLQKIEVGDGPKTADGMPSKEVKVWHNADLKKCGVRFDYGKRYRVRARKVGDNLETDFCLMKDLQQSTTQ
jgi:hypothetical protein